MFYFISVDYELNKGSDIEIGLRYVISIYISILATGSHGDSTSDKFKLINVSRLVFVCLLLVVYKVDFFSPLFFHSNHHKLDTTRMSLLPSTNICASHMIRQLILPHRNKQFQYPFFRCVCLPLFQKIYASHISFRNMVVHINVQCCPFLHLMVYFIQILRSLSDLLDIFRSDDS